MFKFKLQEVRRDFKPSHVTGTCEPHWQATVLSADSHTKYRTSAECTVSQLSFSSPTMSATTPGASSQSPGPSSPTNAPQDPLQNASPTDRVVLDYLRSRGHAGAEKALLEAIDAISPDDKGKQPDTVAADELVKRLAVFAQKPSRPGENIFKESSNVLQELTAMGNPTNIQNFIASIGSVGAEDILSLDPTDKQEGFRELEAWVDGSLDMYRVRHVEINVVVSNNYCIARIPSDSFPNILSLLSGFNSTWFQRSWYVQYSKREDLHLIIP
jgi:hypothetical protein